LVRFYTRSALSSRLPPNLLYACLGDVAASKPHPERNLPLSAVPRAIALTAHLLFSEGRLSMHRKWFFGAVFASASLIASAFGQIHVYIGTPPPPLRYEVRSPMPGAGYVWTEGYWGDEGGHYRWVAGRWNQPPYAGAYLEPSPLRPLPARLADA
jgi:hypothetical protein